MKTFLTCILIALVLFSCNRRTVLQSDSQFSPLERQLIFHGVASDPMRVYLITNETDSILLRKKSQPVNLPTESKELDLFTQRLLSTVQDSASMGVGIAAPQVGILKNIIWIQRFDKENFPFEVYYNPKILSYSIDKQDCKEGCLSIPNLTGITQTRAFSILLEHQTLDGKFISETINGFTAVIFQHEIDHLNGILFIDHLKNQ